MSRLLPPLLVLLAPCCLGAAIEWSLPLNIAGVDDLSVEGVLLEARNATNDGSSPTVEVDGEKITFQALNLRGPLSAAGTFYTGGGGDTGSAALNAVLDSHTWAEGPWSFQLTGLVAGTKYQIQLIGAGDTRDCCSARNQRAGDGEPGENISKDFSRSGVGSVIGTFTAGGTTQTIRILKGSVDGEQPALSGYLLREVAPVPQSDPTAILLSNSELAPHTSTGTAIGTFSTIDANLSDTHQYALVASTGASNHNALFAIVGDELQAASELGGFGSSYAIQVQSTDSTGRTIEASFDLRVEEAEAPVGVQFSATTVLRALPMGGRVGSFRTEDPNRADRHSYALVPGIGDHHNGRFRIVENELRTAAPMPAAGSLLSIRVRSTDLSGLAVESQFQITVVHNSLRINEFLADKSSSTVVDEDGERADWIELHNPAEGSVNLEGAYLTDDPGNLTKWRFPAVTIRGGGFLVVLASGKNRTSSNGDPLHTNFGLAQGGEYLALVGPDGKTVRSEFGPGGSPYPSQRAGVSYGFFGSPLQIGFMFHPTPNAANDASRAVFGFVADTEFEIDRGFFSEPFTVGIRSATPDATIRYTTDGSWPSPTAGIHYTGPVLIDRSQPLKAIAYKSGFEPSNVDTQSYLFTEDVVRQTSSNTQTVWGFPSSWDGQEPYYGMNRNPGINPETHATLREDLVAIPSLSIAMEFDDLFGERGIYSHPQSSGAYWERKASLEVIAPGQPEGAENVQLNCALRMQGGAFRSFGLTRKKSFRVLFKSRFGNQNLPTGGPGKLTYPLFGADAADEFQTLVLRMEANDGWQWSGAGGQSQYARDEFARRAQLALGQPASHGRYCHLYLNGVYWGVYNVVERPDSGFAESSLGAARDQWQGQNSGNPINDATDIVDWEIMNRAVAEISSAASIAQREVEYLQACGFDENGTRNPDLPVWIDPSNYIDYLLVNWYGGNSDWPHKNYYCGRAREPDSTGFKFFLWDAEWTLSLRSQLNTNLTGNFKGVAAPQQHLEESQEYRVRFGDRAHAALFNGGVFAPPKARALYQEIVAQHPRLLNPEAARWGNQHGGARTVFGDWHPEFSKLVHPSDGWFAQRAGILLNQLRARKLYPALQAPTYSQHGGSVPSGGGPTLGVPNRITRIYYRFGPGDADPTDYVHSLDPRLVGGGVHPEATLIEFPALTVEGGRNTSAPIVLTEPGYLFSRSYHRETGAWSALTTALFTIDTVSASADNTVVSEIHYHPEEPRGAELKAGFADQDLFEFLEVQNIGSFNVDMTEVAFIEGVEFEFPPGFTLAPGQRTVIVKNPDAFRFRYAGLPGPRIAGVFLNGSGLRNSGEILTLRSANRSIIKRFAYDDEAPWPTAPDGRTGVSLVLMDASSNPDHSLAHNWRPSAAVGGIPGGSDVLSFRGDPNADHDADGVTALVEHAIGTSDGEPSDNNTVKVSRQQGVAGGVLGAFPTVTYTRELRAEDVEIVPESSTNMANWNSSPVELVFVSEERLSGTKTLVTYRVESAFETYNRIFIRLRVQMRVDPLGIE